MTARTDAALGLGAMVLGGLYFAQAAAIEDSLLSDAIGAGGVPKGIACLIIGAGALLLARSLWGARKLPPPLRGRALGGGAAPRVPQTSARVDQANSHPAPPPPAGEGEEAGLLQPHLKALGLLALLAGYILLLPLLGYAATILLLAVAVAAYAGAPLRPSLLLFGAGTTALLWGAFVGLLGVPLPQGSLFGG